MRIFNNKGSNLELPLGNGQKISVLPYSVSADFLPSTNFLVMVASTFGFEDLSLIVNGIQEINACSSVSTCNGFVVYSVSEAVERMNKLKEKATETPVNPATITKEQQDEEVKEFNKKKNKKKESGETSNS